MPTLFWNVRFRDTRPCRRCRRRSGRDRAERLARSDGRHFFRKLEPMKFLSRSLLIAGLSVVCATSFAQTRDLSSSGVLLDRIAAVVNEGVVLNSQLDEQTDEIIARLREQKTELPPRNVLRRQILERLGVERIQQHAAAK